MVLLLLVKLSELLPREKVAAPVIAKVPETARFPPMPTFPRVESVETVRDPVTLLVSLIDIPPLPFEIWPDEFNCVQVTPASVVLPVTFKVPVNAELPVILMPPAVLPIRPLTATPVPYTG